MNSGKHRTVAKEASSEVGGQRARRSCDGITGTLSALLGVPGRQAASVQRESGRRQQGAGHTERRRWEGRECLTLRKKKKKGRAEIDN